MEANLGGFEVEQEWVKEIDRKRIVSRWRRSTGGTPPIPGRAYEISVRLSLSLSLRERILGIWVNAEIRLSFVCGTWMPLYRLCFLFLDSYQMHLLSCIFT